MTRQGHLEWAKSRALQYVDAGELANAVASMGSDLSKHEAFQGPQYSGLVVLGLMAIKEGPAAVRRWVEGYN